MLKLILPLLIIVLPLLGSLFNNSNIYLFNILLICFMVILVASNKVEKAFWGFYLFSIGLSLIWTTSVYSPYLIGTDIHKEYYFFRQGLIGWDTSVIDPFNSSLLLSVILPYLSKLLGVSGYFLFKVICPLPLALVPVVQYKIFSKIFDRKTAFFGAIFFISFVSFLLEIPSIVKMEVGLIFFAVEIFLLLSKPSKLNYILIALTGTLVATIHYTVWALSILYFSITLVILLGLRLLFKIKVPSLKGLLLSILPIVLVGGLYLNFVAGGIALACIKGLGGYFISTTVVEYIPGSTLGAQNITGPVNFNPIGDILKVPIIEKINRLDPFLRGALGLDFFDVDIWGKIFRILQLITEIFLIVGLLQSRKLSPICLGLSITAFLLLGSNLVVPGVSSILNATRWYQIALFILTPLAIDGVFILLKNKAQTVICLVLIPYLLFTSGFIFEVAKLTDTSTIIIPFSTSLSGYRLDLGSEFSKNDFELAEYVGSSGVKPILADINGSSILLESIGGLFLESRVKFFPPSGCPIGPTYIYLREKNEKDKIITYWAGTGLKKTYSYSELKMDIRFSRCKLIKQVGESKLYYYGGD